MNNQNYFKEYFWNKFKIQLELNVTRDDTRVSTVDRFNNRREYDINFDHMYGGLILYKLYSDTRSVMLGTYTKNSTPSAIIKQVLQDIYKDTSMG